MAGTHTTSGPSPVSSYASRPSGRSRYCVVAIADKLMPLANDVKGGAMSPRAGLSAERVATLALYKHVGGLVDLRDRVSVRVVAELTERVRDAVVGVAGEDAVRAVLREYRDYLVRYPHRAGLLVNPAASEPAAELLDVVLAVLAGFGLSGAAAIHAARGLRSAVHGFAVLQAGGGFGLPEDLAESFRLLSDAVVVP